MRLAVVTLAAAAFITAMGSAAACTCTHPYPGQPGFEDSARDLQAWWFARARTVVQGRIVSIKTPSWWSRDNTYRTTMRVTAVLKGQVPAGELTVLTGSGGGDCGFGEDFAGMAGTPREVSLEVFPVDDRETGAYGVGLCAYYDFTNANGK